MWKLERTENRSNAQVMKCSIQLSATNFRQQDQFTVKSPVNTLHIRNLLDVNQYDRCAARVQPKRAVRFVNNRKSNTSGAKIDTANATTSKNTTSKQQSKALCKPSRSKRNVLVEVGQLVLAKQKFSVPWPSRISAVNKDSVYVYFFGDGRSGSVKKCDLFSIFDSKDIVVNCLKRNITNYRKCIIEMEKILGVPDNLSMTNFN